MRNPDHDTMVSNVLRVWARASASQREAGAAWYADAHDDAMRYGRTTPERMIATIALTSPRNSWALNVRLARRLVEQHADGLALTGYLSAPLTKVARVLDGEDPFAVLAGQKIRAFYECILYSGQTDTVCVDRHALAIVHGARIAEAEQGMTPRQYAQVVAAYQAAARQLGIPAAIVQATTWVVWRGSAA